MDISCGIMRPLQLTHASVQSLDMHGGCPSILPKVLEMSWALGTLKNQVPQLRSTTTFHIQTAHEWIWFFSFPFANSAYNLQPGTSFHGYRGTRREQLPASSIQHRIYPLQSHSPTEGKTAIRLPKMHLVSNGYKHSNQEIFASPLATAPIRSHSFTPPHLYAL
ncbi:unnamed protein product [Protopolystoma xenopodis]|uniref:Uncharacterized protein n=1 Tax=Protopolystoma xenopodis TaxID=117903 RepID=A0A448XIW5_9PLAT|nr:unnamed protein product [Protopolystoma xenopodis]